MGASPTSSSSAIRTCWIGEPPSPESIAAAERLGAVLARWFRLRTHAFNRIPDGPCLIVCNHSAGAVWEVFLLLHAWRRHFGDRLALGLAHRIGWEPPFDRMKLSRIGAVFAHPKVAHAALGRGAALLVFPGGDVEASRRFRDRYRVTFAGRSGFVTVARAAGVPIVPIVICGSHAAYLSLPGGERVSRVLGLERLLGMKAWPLTAGEVGLVATLLSPLLWPLAPLALAQAIAPIPSTIEIEAMDPMTVDTATDAEVALRVEAAMQGTMDRLAAKRRTPWW